jgi:class 3 adenylate cyclase
VSEPAALPTGTVTFVLTDIEGSSRLWQDHPDQMGAVIDRHDELLRSVVAANHGSFVKSKGEGDSSFSVFPRPTDAAAAAVAAQLALASEHWPDGIEIRVRAALHSGEAELRDGDYYGSAVNRCARLRTIAHGGQTICSQATAELLAESLPPGAALTDLGAQRLRDLERPERIFQICHPDLPADFPPLRSLQALPNNLPSQLTTFIGREADAGAVRALLKSSRIVTLTG